MTLFSETRYRARVAEETSGSLEIGVDVHLGSPRHLFRSHTIRHQCTRGGGTSLYLWPIPFPVDRFLPNTFFFYQSLPIFES